MEAAMWRKLAIFLIPVGSAASLAERAYAQAQNPPWDAWFGPWPMWGGWSSWWWICPLMMVLMMLAMLFACRFMGSWHRD
jgi:uncharacterized membrane protein